MFSLGKFFKGGDGFGRNVLVVFFGTSLLSIFNLLYQLLIAHRLSPVDFAAFNSLLSLFLIFSAPLLTLQAVTAKFAAEFAARNEVNKIKTLFSRLLLKSLLFSLGTFFVFLVCAPRIASSLKIPSYGPVYMLMWLVAFAWILPVLLGGLQGLKKFNWFVFSSISGGGLKLILAFVFISVGFGISGALGGYLVATIVTILIAMVALRSFIVPKAQWAYVHFKEIYRYFFPLIISNLCFTGLVNSDMVLVKYYFSPEKAGLYSLSQMVGKIFLFLPMAISVVMFPHASSLNARAQDARPVLNKSLLYAASLCIAAIIFYNLFPGLTLIVLTGKIHPESIFVGRLFSISMTCFALSFLLMNYFLSIKDLRFIKFIFIITGTQLLSIVIVHHSLAEVQYILCLSAFVLFSSLFILSRKNPS